MDPDEVRRGVEIANVFIAYRMRSEFEVRRRLKRENIEAEEADAVVAELVRMRLLDDRAFAGAYARDQMLGRKRGPLRVRRGLSALGIHKELAAEAVDEVAESLDLLEQAFELGQKRWANLSRKVDSARRRKRLYDYLVRRGYTYEQARTVVDRLENEAK